MVRSGQCWILVVDHVALSFHSVFASEQRTYSRELLYSRLSNPYCGLCLHHSRLVSISVHIQVCIFSNIQLLRVTTSWPSDVNPESNQSHLFNHIHNFHCPRIKDTALTTWRQHPTRNISSSSLGRSRADYRELLERAGLKLKEVRVFTNFGQALIIGVKP